MAFDAMTFLSHNKFKILIFVIVVIIFIQTIKHLPVFHSMQETDVDHGSSEGGTLLPVDIAVYYEALCPDSKNFVIRQLKPTVEKAQRLVRVSYVAYGKAKTMVDKNGNLTFSCQHGPIECLGNKVHACGVEKIKDPQKQLEYVACMIADNYEPLLAGKSCANQLNIEWDPISNCATGREGSLLLKRNGEKTANLRPAVTFIPTVLLDNHQWRQAAILKNLLKEVCSHFKIVPPECEDVTFR